MNGCIKVLVILALIPFAVWGLVVLLFALWGFNGSL